jgi:hypothetical protein
MESIKKLSPWDWIYIINFKTYEGQPITTENGFSVYIILQHMSSFSDTIFISQTLNELSILPIELQFWFLYNSITKRKRFSKWIKRDSSPELKSIMSYYNCNIQRAAEYLDRLTKEEIIDIVSTVNQDGV